MKNVCFLAVWFCQSFAQLVEYSSSVSLGACPWQFSCFFKNLIVHCYNVVQLIYGIIQCSLISSLSWLFWAAVFIVCECQDTNGENSFIDSHTS